jgi:hypothetical protein
VTQTSSPVQTTRLPRFLTAALAAVALLASLLIGAAPAQAAYSIAFTPTGGSVGTPIALTSSVSSGVIGVGVGTVAYYASGAKVAEAAVDATGKIAAATWTPLKAGSVPMYATYASTDGTQTATSAVGTVTIAKAKSTTTLTAPTTAKTGAVVTLTATVKAGNYVPTGTVTFALPNGTVLAPAALDPKGVATLNVQMPTSATTYQAKATYTGDDNASGSTSDTVSVAVTTSGSVIDLTASAGPYAVGRAITLTANLSPSSLTGSVSFTAGGTVIGAQQASGGKATLTWTPTTGGTVRVAAAFTPTGSSAPLGTDTVDLAVATNLPPNTITLGPTGQAAWANGQGVALRYQQTVTLTARTVSGAAVGLSVAGPCSLTGTTLTATAGAGTCTLTATSPQTTAYSSAQQVNPIALARGRQTATLVAPASGKLVRNSAYRLALPSTRTNVGNTVVWRVSTGKARCKVTVGSDGTVFLRTVKKGRCTVRASAPPVIGQWLAFKAVYKYRVR